MKKSKKAEPGADTIRRGIYILPNAITATSLFFGFWAIVGVFNGQFKDAAIYILISGVLDGLDGKVARLTGTSSKFGVEFDSMADLIAEPTSAMEAAPFLSEASCDSISRSRSFEAIKCR